LLGVFQFVEFGTMWFELKLRAVALGLSFGNANSIVQVGELPPRNPVGLALEFDQCATVPHQCRASNGVLKYQPSSFRSFFADEVSTRPSVFLDDASKELRILKMHSFHQRVIAHKQ
jgi:hypothetical protein